MDLPSCCKQLYNWTILHTGCFQALDNWLCRISERREGKTRWTACSPWYSPWVDFPTKAQRGGAKQNIIVYWASEVETRVWGCWSRRGYWKGRSLIGSREFCCWEKGFLHRSLAEGCATHTQGETLSRSRREKKVSYFGTNSRRGMLEVSEILDL